MLNTFAPDSVTDPTIFGLKISVKPCWSKVDRKPAADAEARVKGARSFGCRSETGA